MVLVPKKLICKSKISFQFNNFTNAEYRPQQTLCLIEDQHLEMLPSIRNRTLPWHSPHCAAMDPTSLMSMLCSSENWHSMASLDLHTVVADETLRFQIAVEQVFGLWSILDSLPLAGGASCQYLSPCMLGFSSKYCIFA